jgi:vacuolar-type H+-ATPase catalytic subunit A/Vma1
MERIKNIFFEMIPVILGILIALWTENVREELDNQEKLDEIIKLVGRETKENISDLSISVEHNRVAKDTLTKYLTNSQLSLIEIIKKTGGLRVPIVKSYTPTLLYGLNNKYKIANWKLISTIAENQEAIQVVKNRAADITNLDFTAKSQSEKQKLDLILGDLLFNGKNILTNFNKIDSLVKNIKN